MFLPCKTEPQSLSKRHETPCISLVCVQQGNHSQKTSPSNFSSSCLSDAMRLFEAEAVAEAATIHPSCAYNKEMKVTRFYAKSRLTYCILPAETYDNILYIANKI